MNFFVIAVHINTLGIVKVQTLSYITIIYVKVFSFVAIFFQELFALNKMSIIK